MSQPVIKDWLRSTGTEAIRFCCWRRVHRLGVVRALNRRVESVQHLPGVFVGRHVPGEIRDLLRGESVVGRVGDLYVEHVPLRIVLGLELNSMEMVVAVGGAADDGEAAIVCKRGAHDRGPSSRIKEGVFVQDGAVEINASDALIGLAAAVEPDGRSGGEDDGEPFRPQDSGSLDSSRCSA